MDSERLDAGTAVRPDRPMPTIGVDGATPADDPDRGAMGDRVEPSRPTEERVADPVLVLVGAAVAARRRALGLAQRTLARDKVINAGTLIELEKGRRWPRASTRARLEEALHLAPGTIESLRAGRISGLEGDRERAPIDGALEQQAECMSQAVELAFDALERTVAALPDPTTPEFSTRASAVLTDLRRLEVVASNATRGARGASALLRILSEVRQTYRDLMLRAARSPEATLGQALYAARRRAELSVDEAAEMVGVSPEVIVAAESDDALIDDDRRSIDGLVRALRGR